MAGVVRLETGLVSEIVESGKGHFEKVPHALPPPPVVVSRAHA
jgi:hypothetical protein